MPDEDGGPPQKKAHLTDENQYKRVLQDYSLIITVIEATITSAGRFKKGSKKGQNHPDKHTEKNLGAFEFSICLDTTFQEFLEAIAQAMWCRVSSIALDALEVKLFARGAKKAKLDSDQAWKVYARKLSDAIFQKSANVDIEVYTLAPTNQLPHCVSL